MFNLRIEEQVQADVQRLWPRQGRRFDSFCAVGGTPDVLLLHDHVQGYGWPRSTGIDTSLNLRLMFSSQPELQLSTSLSPYNFLFYNICHCKPVHSLDSHCLGVIAMYRL